MMTFVITEKHLVQIEAAEAENPLPDVAKAMLCSMAEYLETLEAAAADSQGQAKSVLGGWVRTAQRIFDDSLLIAEGIEP